MKKEYRKIVVIGGSVLFFCLLVRYWNSIAGMAFTIIGAAKALLIGCAMAYVINILMKFYEGKILGKCTVLKTKQKRVVAVLLSYISIIVIIAGVLYLVVSELFSCIQTLVLRVPGILSGLKIDTKLNELFPNLMVDFDIQNKLMSAFEGIMSQLSGFMGGAVSWVSSTASMVVTVFVAFIFSIYLLFGKEKIGGQIRRLGRLYIKKSWREKIYYVINTLDKSFHKFIVGQSIEAVILGSLCVIGMLILRLPYAGMIGTLVGFSALIPVAGAYIGSVVGAVMILTESPIQALIFIIFLVLLQQVEGNLIYPRVVGSSIGLPGIWVFAAIIVGGGIWGIPGMLFGVPITAALYQMVRDSAAKREAVLRDEIQQKAVRNENTATDSEILTEEE